VQTSYSLFQNSDLVGLANDTRLINQSPRSKVQGADFSLA
jgi:hypothetical protein